MVANYSKQNTKIYAVRQPVCIPNAIFATADVCELPPVVGDCDTAIRRFFFNSTSQRCEIFIYGGCGGNANNFVEESECVRTCQSGTYITYTIC